MPDNTFYICFQGELLAQFDDQGIDMVKHERLVVSNVKSVLFVEVGAGGW